MTRKLTYEHLKDYFAGQECELLDVPHYQSDKKTLLEFRCQCGNVCKKTFKNFKRVPRCIDCSIEYKRESAKHRRIRTQKPNEQIQVKQDEKWKTKQESKLLLYENNVRDYFAKYGCELLEESCLPPEKTLKYKCKCGGIYQKKFISFKQNQNCPKCHPRKDKYNICRKNDTNIKALNYDYVKNFFAKNGCELLEESYSTAQIPLKFRCKCNNIHQKRFNDFQDSPQCPKCSGVVRYTLEDVQNIFKQYGCELLETEHTSVLKKIKYCCHCGNIDYVRIANFTKPNHIHGCRECWKKSISKENHYKWNPDREAIELKQKIHRRCCTMLRQTLEKVGQQKTDKKAKMLGYSPQDLQKHLVSHKNWDEVKDKKWSIDHIFPVNAFVKMGLLDVKLINSLDNLQPMDWIENLKKSDTYDHKAFLSWLATKRINSAAS